MVAPLLPAWSPAIAETGTLTAGGPVSLSGSTNFDIRLGTLPGAFDSDLLAESGTGAIALSGTLNLSIGQYMSTLTPAAKDNLYYLIVNGGANAHHRLFRQCPGKRFIIVAGGYTFSIQYDMNFISSTSIAGSGNDVVLELTSIPEPGTWATMTGGFGMLLIVRRVRRNARS